MKRRGEELNRRMGDAVCNHFDICARRCMGWSFLVSLSLDITAYISTHGQNKIPKSSSIFHPYSRTESVLIVC